MSERAVSEVVSYVLVFGLVVSAVGIISVSGLSTLEDTQNNEQIENAERAFSVMSDNIADIHRRDAPSRATEISLDDAQISTGENVTIRVTVDETSGNTVQEEWQIRPVIYSGSEDRQLVYEAGATFRTSRDGGLRVEDPPFVLSDNRVLIPVIGLNQPSQQSLGGSTVLIRTRLQETSLAYTDAGGNVDRVTVTIEDSQHEALWTEYFEDNGFSCSSVADGISCESPSGIGTVHIVYHDIAVSIES